MSTLVEVIGGVFMNFRKGGFFFFLFTSFYISKVMNPDESLTSQWKKNCADSQQTDRQREREKEQSKNSLLCSEGRGKRHKRLMLDCPAPEATNMYVCILIIHSWLL